MAGELPGTAPDCNSAPDAGPDPRPWPFPARRHRGRDRIRHGDRAAPAGERRLSLFYTAEVHGTPEPCGCTSDPLGDVARYAALVRAAARTGPVLVVDAGGLSFPESSTPKEKQANAARAAFLGDALGRMGPPFAAGLAETDIMPGSGVSPRPNASPATSRARRTSRRRRLETVGGVRVGIIGVADPALASGIGATAEDPVRPRSARRRRCERRAPSW